MNTAVIFFHLLTLPAMILAQEAETRQNSLREGSMALLFQVGTDFTLRPFQGGALAAKYHLTPDQAIRLTIGISGGVNDGTSASAPTAPDTNTTTRSIDGSTNSINLQASFQYLWYLPSVEPIHLFVGVGPQVQYRREHGESTDITSVHNIWTSMLGTRITKSWGVGAAGALGLEWFFSQSFSLQAEYGLLAMYASSSYSDETKVTSNSPYTVYPGMTSSGTSKGWSLTSDSFRFGLTAYF
jgi:hypothetical protein